MAVSRTAYFGTFVHSKSLEELEISHNSVICVDEHGKIAAVERDLPNVSAVGAVLEKLRWISEEKGEEKPQEQHIEHVNGHAEHGGHVHHDGECMHYDEHHSDNDSMEGLEHVGNGVLVLENSVNGHVPNGHAAKGAVAESRPEVKLVMCGKEEFFFPGFIGPFLLPPLLFLFSGPSRLTPTRHTHPRLPIPQRRHLRQNHIDVLARKIHLSHRSLPLLSSNCQACLQPGDRPHVKSWNYDGGVLCDNRCREYESPGRPLS